MIRSSFYLIKFGFCCFFLDVWLENVKICKSWFSIFQELTYILGKSQDINKYIGQLWWCSTRHVIIWSLGLFVGVVNHIRPLGVAMNICIFSSLRILAINNLYLWQRQILKVVSLQKVSLPLSLYTKNIILLLDTPKEGQLWFLYAIEVTGNK